MSSNSSGTNGTSPAAPTDDLPGVLQDDPGAPAAWRHVWPRALQAPGFDPRRHSHGLALACLAWVRYDRSRRVIAEMPGGGPGFLLAVLEEQHRLARVAACRMRLITDPGVLRAPLGADGDDVELAALFRG